MDVPFWIWASVLGCIVVMLAVDLFAHRRAHVIGVREAAVWSGVWVALGVGFGVLVWRAWGAVLNQNFSWVLYVFAAFLLWTGYRMIRQRNEHLNPEQSMVLRGFRRVVPMTDVYHGQKLLVRSGLGARCC